MNFITGRESEIEWQHSIAMWDAALNKKHHPELKEGERFHQNIRTDEIDLYVNFEKERVGNIAYDIHGNILTGLVPVFYLPPKISAIAKAIRELKKDSGMEISNRLGTLKTNCSRGLT